MATSVETNMNKQRITNLNHLVIFLYKELGKLKYWGPTGDGTTNSHMHYKRTY